MPTYVYRFVDSGDTIEVQQSFADAALTEAPHPDNGEMRPVKKVFTPVGITFKGNGFYKTDSRGKSSGSNGSGSGSSSSGGSATDSGSSSNGSSSNGESGSTSSSSGSSSSASGSSGSTSHSRSH